MFHKYFLINIYYIFFYSSTTVITQLFEVHTVYGYYKSLKQVNIVLIYKHTYNINTSLKIILLFISCIKAKNILR